MAAVAALQDLVEATGAINEPPNGVVHVEEPTSLTQPPEEEGQAGESVILDSLAKYEGLFILTPDRMRSIVDAFEEVLDRGLQEHGQVVVRPSSPYHCDTRLI